jgi:hypothetical protein
VVVFLRTIVASGFCSDSGQVDYALCYFFFFFAVLINGSMFRFFEAF